MSNCSEENIQKDLKCRLNKRLCYTISAEQRIRIVAVKWMRIKWMKIEKE